MLEILIINILVLLLIGSISSAVYFYRKNKEITKAVKNLIKPKIILWEVSAITQEDYEILKGNPLMLKTVIKIIKYQLAQALEDFSTIDLSDKDMRVNQGIVNWHTRIVATLSSYILQEK